MRELRDLLLTYADNNSVNLADIAKKLNIPPTTLYNWVQGKCVPNRMRRVLLADMFNYTVEEFESKFFANVELSESVYLPFNTELIRCMAKNNMTYRGLARALNLDPPTVCAWIDGSALPRSRIIPKLSVTLQVSPVHLAKLITDSNTNNVPCNALSYIMKVVRLATGSKVRDAANWINTAHSSWHNWEYGGVMPSCESMDKLAALFDISIERAYSYHSLSIEKISMLVLTNAYTSVLHKI